MICRLWRGWATRDNADAYERIVRGQVIPGIEAQRIPGFCSIDLVRRERDHDVEFMTLMWFDTLDAVKAFMGEDYEVAHVPAEAQAVLADFDKRSAHYEVLDRRDQPGVTIPAAGSPITARAADEPERGHAARSGQRSRSVTSS